MGRKPKNIAKKEMDLESEIQRYNPRYQGLIQESSELKIIDDITYKRGIDLVRDLNILSNSYKKLRNFIVKPFKDHIKVIEGRIKPFENKIKDIVGDYKSGLKGQMSNYEIKKREEAQKKQDDFNKQQQEQYKEQVSSAEQNGEIVPTAPVPIKVEREKEEGVQFRDNYIFEIEDESKVPNEINGVLLKMLNTKAIQGLIDAGVRQIEGLKIFNRPIPVIKEQKIEDL